MPKLKINITPSLEKLDLMTKGLVNGRFMGNYASTFKGKGLEFSSYRNYTQSDDASAIDWTASNRSRRLLIKEFVEERNLKVYFLLDSSSKMLLGSTDKLKVEYAAELVASFSHAILKAGDLSGLTMFSNDIIKNMIPGNGMKQFYTISDSLSNLSLYGGKSNIKRAIKHAINTFEDGAVVILISDFINIESFTDELKFAAQKFDLIGIMIRDPIDRDLPEGMGQVLVEDPETGEKMLISPNKFKDLYAKETRRDVAKLDKMFRETGADFLPLYTNKPFAEDLIGFFKRRALEWR